MTALALPRSTELEHAAPPPLAPLSDVIISPANVEAETRAKHARLLSAKERKAIRRELAALKASPWMQQWKRVKRRRAQLWPKMEALYAEYLTIKEASAGNPTAEQMEQLHDLRKRLVVAKAAWDASTKTYQELRPTAETAQALMRALGDHPIAVARDRYQAKLRVSLLQECKIYERIILEHWTRLGYCHRYMHKQKERVERVQFSEVVSTLDAHYYKIDTAYQTAFKNWKNNLPQGVRISTQLLDPETLDELSISCQRQVTGSWGPDGAWVIVHRLNSVDGLMNYVSYDDTMERYPASQHTSMPICIGVAANRQVQWVKLAEFPHWLIGGYTLSGKSNMLNVGLCTLISRQRPDDLRLVLIDLKGGLEFNFYESVPHLHGEIIDSITKVSETVASLEALMEARFKKFRAARVKKIEEYHAVRPNEVMPRVLMVFDEVASIAGSGETTKRIAASLKQIAAKGRAVGLHIWLCTQRPDVSIVEGALKGNLAVRISGRMTTSSDSVTILGSSAARDLAAIPGRMVLQMGPDPIPLQTPHITEANIQDAIKLAQAYPAPAPLDMPLVRVVHQEWTVEKVIELSVKHLAGNITWKQVYQAADDLSQSQARELVERIWAMDVIEFEGKQYRVEKGRSNTRRLVEIPAESV